MSKKSTTKKQKKKYTRKQKNIIQYVPINNSGGMQTQGHPINSNIQWLPNNIPTQSDNTDASRIISELMSKIEGPRQTQTQNVYINSNDIKQQQNQEQDNSNNVIKNISQNMEPQTPAEIIAEGTLSSAIGGALAIGGVGALGYGYGKIKSKGGIRGTLLSVGETLYNTTKNTGNRLGGRSSKNRLVEETEPLLEPGIKYEKTKLKQNRNGYSQLDEEVDDVNLIDKRFSAKTSNVEPKQLKFTPLKTVADMTGLITPFKGIDPTTQPLSQLQKKISRSIFVTEEEKSAAKKIQAKVKRKIIQPLYQLGKQTKYNESARTIQSAFRNKKAKEKVSELKENKARVEASIYERKKLSLPITRSQTELDRRTIEPVRSSFNPPTDLLTPIQPPRTRTSTVTRNPATETRSLYASDHPEYRRGQRARNSNNPLPVNPSPEFMSGYNSKEQAKRGRPPKNK